MTTEKENYSRELENKKFLFIGLSDRWGTKERGILRDCLIAKNNGIKAYLYCHKKSFLSEKAKAQGIEVIYHKGKFYTKFVQWYKLRALKKLIVDLDIDLIHCYNIKILWPIAFFIRRRLNISLVLTQGNEVQKFYRNLYYKPLSSRIDQVLLPMNEMVENIWGHLGVPPRKIKFVGMGCAQEKVEDRKPSPFGFSGERWCIGTNLSGLETNTNFLNTLFNSFQVLTQKGLDEKNYTLVLMCEREWSDFPLTDELKRAVTDRGLEQNIAFYRPTNFAECLEQMDLWIGLSRREDLEDYSVQSLLSGVPVVMPRSAASMEIISELGTVAETYKRDDSRELREKVEKLLLNLDTYKSSLNKGMETILESHGQDVYQTKLLETYAKIIKKRDRLLKRKVRLRGLKKS
ncbi:MAG: glycosyltransferase family 4 protein [Oligoflexia bacterium]|nr:glycosyltransferase family 4 protein [Oligoflexia bacterium]